VEDCLQLDANRLTRQGLLKEGSDRGGILRWPGPGGGDFDVRYAANTVNPDSAFLHLSYSWAGGAPGEQGSAEYRVWLTTTRLRYGGLRWWFACPLVVGAGPAGAASSSCTCRPRPGTSAAGTATS
jgi:hypothetical protein